MRPNIHRLSPTTFHNVCFPTCGGFVFVEKLFGAVCSGVSWWAHQYVEAGGFEQGDLISNGQRCEAGQLLGELHCLNDAFSGQLTELVPKTDIQRDTVFGAVALQSQEVRVLTDENTGFTCTFN